MGGVGLGAGSDLTLNFDGNKLLDIRVDAGVANALASNGGLLKADGGRVLMAARTANALLNTVVNSQVPSRPVRCAARTGGSCSMAARTARSWWEAPCPPMR